MISIAFQGTSEEVIKEMRGFLEGLGALPTLVNEQKLAASKVETPTGREMDLDEVKKARADSASKATPKTDLLAEIKAIIPKLVKAKGRPAVVELLAEFGATSGGEIKDEDRMTFLTKAKSLLPE